MGRHNSDDGGNGIGLLEILVLVLIIAATAFAVYALMT